jgi:predicted NUDIX family NTP pyrophosphohydrolase
VPSTRTKARHSAGLLLFRHGGDGLEVLLVHPGGPFWAKRDEGVWSIPKGEYEPDEPPFKAALREFREELGTPAPGGEALYLGEVRQKSGKLVRAWALEGDLDAGRIASNTFSLEWPPRSGKISEFPEVDRAEWFTIERARERLNRAQVALLERLVEQLG